MEKYYCEILLCRPTSVYIHSVASKERGGWGGGKRREEGGGGRRREEEGGGGRRRDKKHGDLVGGGYSKDKPALQLASFPGPTQLSVTCSMEKPALPYCKRQKAGQGLGTRLHSNVIWREEEGGGETRSMVT